MGWGVFGMIYAYVRMHIDAHGSFNLTGNTVEFLL